jgi:hypothetical protein
MRQRYRGLYQNFRPACCFWGLVLLARKLLFAAIAVMCNHQVALQVCAATTDAWRTVPIRLVW